MITVCCQTAMDIVDNIDHLPFSCKEIREIKNTMSDGHYWIRATDRVGTLHAGML